MALQRIDGRLTAEQLRAALNYDHETGIFRWRERPNVRATTNARLAGKQAGCTRHDGYVSIRVNTVQLLAHRLAWLHVHGTWPGTNVDHIDGNPNNNRINNLRQATQLQNTKNRRASAINSHGFKGISWHKKACKWSSQIMKDGKSIYLGLYLTPEAAHAAYCDAATRLHGTFARFS